MSLGVARLRGVAIGVTGLLLLVLLWGGGRVLFLPAPEQHLPAESSLRVAGVAGAEQAQELATDLTERPLFWYGRKPYEPPAAEVVVSEAPEEVLEMAIDEVQLVGVLGAGDQSGIIVTHAGTSRRLALDDEIEGWSFIGLSDDGARFASEGRTRVLTMEHAAPSAPPKRKDKSSADKSDKSDKKAGKKSRDEDRTRKRAKKSESRTNEGGSRQRPRMTSVWGGPPKKAEPEEPADDAAQ